MTIRDLQPKLIWEIFDEITAVPRPSKHEEKIIEYLLDFAKRYNLEAERDQIGNVVIRKAATAGYEGVPTVILQSHMDMVCEKNSDTVHDFMTEPIRTKIEDGWVKAEGTTLGADCGIGMAAALAVLVDPTVEHGAIEALFTVDEETGLTGAFNLGEGMLTGKYLINLDSEDEGEIFIGCAGGVDTLGYFAYQTEKLPAGYEYYRIGVSGLKGGHSGDDIDKGLGNANKILAHFLYDAERFGIRLGMFDGGNLRNAIPREAYAVVAVPEHTALIFETSLANYVSAVKALYAATEPNLKITLAQAAEQPVIDEDTQSSLLAAIVGLPNGVLAMSQTMKGLVETSTNTASVKFVDGKIVVTTSQRSSVEIAKKNAMHSVEAVLALSGATVEHSDGYPGWTPNPNSSLLAWSIDSYKSLFGAEPKVRAIHAGLECGLFLEKYPHLEMVSFGPTLRGVHSPDERLEIATVDKFWRLLLDVLKRVK
ncbi:MAG: aminoacyl-histidine dipeptidase [Rikenellaceae bacterium]|nr:aminoacyl-histidine dipeptidase [Rikenellaceae bacterium]